MIVISYLSVRYLLFKILLLAEELVKIALRLPLERREGLGNKASGGNSHLRSLARSAGGCVIFFNNILCQLCDTVKVCVGFGRQSLHKIQLDL